MDDQLACPGPSEGSGQARTGVRAAAAGVLAVGIALSAGAFGLVRQAVEHDQHQLLEQRAAEVKTSLLSSVQGQTSALTSLASFVAPGGAPDAQLFRRMAPSLLAPGSGTAAVGLANASRLTVLVAVGSGPAEHSVLTGDRAKVARDAVRSQALATGVFTEGGLKHLLFVVPTPGVDSLLYQEYVLPPVMTVPSTPGSPYAGLRVAVYANVEKDANLVFASASPPEVLDGDLRLTIPVGADSYVMTIGTDRPLGGGMAARTPWLVLGGGLTLTFLVSSMVRSSGRRRAYALDLVDVRTRELRVINQFLEQVLSRGPMVVLRGQLVDGEPRTTYASANLSTVFDIDPAELTAAGALLGWVHPDDVESVRRGREALRTDSGGQTREFRVRAADGTYRWASAVAVQEVDPTTGTGAYAIYLTDISAERAAREALEEAASAAERANRSKTQFLSRMSHELRTPLNAILGFGQILVSDFEGQAREDAEQIVKAGRHLLVLINEVLEITGIESGSMRLSPEPVLIAEVLGEAVDLIRPIADRAGIHLTTGTCMTGGAYAFADRQRLKQILLNLLSNAVKYNRPMGTVAVSCEQVEDRVRLKVADTGPGIPEGSTELVFDPFERLGAANTAIEGTGIGLSLSRHLATAMKGTLACTSAVGKGSTFTLELPAAEGVAEPPDGPEPPGSVASCPPAGGRGKVLYIEDNLSNVRLVERVLAHRAGTELIPATQGGLGLELAREHRPMLVLLDLHLADISGEQVLARLRNDPLLRETPVVILSADATPGLADRLLAGGATACLTKPVDVDELLRLVDTAASRARDHVHA